jgi:hypothetical protein
MEEEMQTVQKSDQEKRERDAHNKKVTRVVEGSMAKYG